MVKLLKLLVSAYLNILNTFSSSIGGKHAFYVFCYPFKAQIRKHQQDYLDTAHQFTLPIDDFHIQCYRWGEGTRKILFVHGWQSNSYRWKKYIESLSKTDFTIYCFDAPGHGNSGSRIGNVPLYNKALTKVLYHIGSVESIVAHSIGSFSTLYTIKQHENLTPKKMVSLASPFSAKDFMDHYFNLLKLSNKTIKNFLTYFKFYAQHEISFFNLENFLPRNKSLGLIIHDKNDKVVTVNYAAQSAELWPNAQLIITDQYDHKLKGDSIVAVVKSFLIDN